MSNKVAHAAMAVKPWSSGCGKNNLRMRVDGNRKPCNYPVVTNAGTTAMNTATLALLDRGTASAFWHAKLDDGRAYFVTSYPNSRLIFVQTIQRRPVSALQGRKLTPVLRAAIDHAEA